MDESGKEKGESVDLLVQGAGIGGLTLAIAARQAGLSVKVIERAPGLSEVGAGIWMAPNALQVFSQLGLSDAIIEAGWKIDSITLADSKSGALQKTDLSKLGEPFGFGTVAIHRSRLQKILLEKLGSDPILFAQSVQSIEQKIDSCRVTLQNGDLIHAKLVVGADGLNSQVRSRIFPGAKKRETGTSSFRTIVKIDSSLGAGPHESLEIWASGCRMGFSRISKTEYYWYLTFDSAPDQKRSATENLSLAKKLFQERFSEWMPLIEHTRAEDLIHTDITDLSPMKNWSEKRIGLIGDAAHATTPNLGQGGAMAVEDAYVLSDELKKLGCTPQALDAFYARRFKKVNQTVALSRTLGKMCHWGNSLARMLRNYLTRATPSSYSAKQWQKIYRLD